MVKLDLFSHLSGCNNYIFWDEGIIYLGIMIISSRPQHH
jgi:hypothetical protein